MNRHHARQRSTGPRGRRHHIWLLAGWLFADLSLALFVISLGAADDANLKPVPAAAAKPAPKASAPKGPRGLRPTPLVIKVRTRPGGLQSSGAERARAQAELLKQLRAHTKKSDRAALVETFGASGEVGEGIRIAKIGNQILAAVAPALVPSSVPRTNYWDGGSDVSRGTIIYHIWLYQ